MPGTTQDATDVHAHATGPSAVAQRDGIDADFVMHDDGPQMIYDAECVSDSLRLLLQFSSIVSSSTQAPVTDSTPKHTISKHPTARPVASGRMYLGSLYWSYL
jgi:hypothetical protein